MKTNSEQDAEPASAEQSTPYTMVLTHDVDILSLRELPWRSRTLWGFVFRLIIENSARFLGRHISARQFLLSSLSGWFMPLIRLGLFSDPIERSFQEMLRIERKHGVRSTLYFITQPGVAGKRPDGRKAPSHRAAHYRIHTLVSTLRRLEKEGWEIGVHGIDTYHDVEAARHEFLALSAILHHERIGHRSHWLYGKGATSWEILRQAGFAYDASYGSNRRIGWPEGRRRPFRPFSPHSFTVLPLNIQDIALLEPGTIGLDPDKAWQQTQDLLREAKEHGDVITILWHTHSFSAPRYWGNLYEKIIAQGKQDGARIMRAQDAVRL
jgi:peptidoglycan/xylan/chitin deacetylase (PgdA/CDA1 family)